MAQLKRASHRKSYIASTAREEASTASGRRRLLCRLVQIVIPGASPVSPTSITCKDSLVNNCPNCKKIIAELKMSTIKAKLETLPAFDCVTLCCPFCGVILLAVPDLGNDGAAVTAASSGH